MASIVIAKPDQYNYSASTIYIQLIHPGSPCIYLRSYLQTLQSLTTIHSGFQLGRLSRAGSWLAKNNIWLFDSQPLPSLNRAEMQKPNLHDSTCRTIQHSVYTRSLSVTGMCLHIPYRPFTGCAKQLALIRVD